MFYSHEVLTSRKYGVATVWLVATLGQKSSARKVGRRAILDVDVPKACETIITPDVPMALRLQSSLLYGVSCVYAQQCGYVLADAQQAQQAIVSLLKIVRAVAVESHVVKAKPEQINLQDDPAFIPGLNFDAVASDLLDLDMGGGLTQHYISDTASLQTPQSQQSSVQYGLQLPSSSGGDIGDFGELHFPGSGSRGGGGASSILARGDENALLPDIDIAFDADGNLFDFDDLGVEAGKDRGIRSAGPSLLPSDPVLDKMRQDVGIQGGQDDDLVLDEVGADPLVPGDEFNLPLDNQDTMLGSDAAHGDQEFSMEPSSTIGAPLRRKSRARKTIPMDRVLEIRNRDLLAMNNGYIDRMVEDWTKHVLARSTLQAKRNAEFWVLGRGIGGVGSAHSALTETWSGGNLYHLLTGKTRGEIGVNGRKRKSDDEDDEPARNVRRRSGDDEPVLPVDDTIMDNYELEVGREAQAPLDDVSSAMPWNVSASIRGSSVQRGNSRPPGSAAGSLPRRGSRMVSASPLFGRATGVPTSDAPFEAGFGDFEDLGPVDDDFELYGPGAAVDTQTAGQSQWQKAVLDRESGNFLDFIANAIEEKEQQRVGNQSGTQNFGKADASIAFNDLLPESSNSRTVAAQALLHVLALGTKNRIRVEQREAFGTIRLQVG